MALGKGYLFKWCLQTNRWCIEIYWSKNACWRNFLWYGKQFCLR